MPDLNRVQEWQARITALINDRLYYQIPAQSVLRDVQSFAGEIFQEIAYEDKELYSQIATYKQSISSYDLSVTTLNEGGTRANLRKVFWDVLTQAKGRVDARVAQMQQAGVSFIPGLSATYYREQAPDNRQHVPAPGVPGQYRQPSLSDQIAVLNAQLDEERAKTQRVKAERDRLIQDRNDYINRVKRAASVAKERDEFATKLEALEEGQAREREQYNQAFRTLQDTAAQKRQALELERDEAVAALQQTRQAQQEACDKGYIDVPTDKLRALVQDALAEQPEPLRDFAQNLLMIWSRLDADHLAALVTKEGMSSLDAYLYSPPPAIGRLSLGAPSDRPPDPAFLSHITALQRDLHRELVERRGLVVISPAQREDFNPSLHQDNADEIVWGSDPNLHNTVHSVRRLGYCFAGQTKRRASVIRCLFAGAQKEQVTAEPEIPASDAEDEPQQVAAQPVDTAAPPTGETEQAAAQAVSDKEAQNNEMASGNDCQGAIVEAVAATEAQNDLVEQTVRLPRPAEQRFPDSETPPSTDEAARGRSSPGVDAESGGQAKFCGRSSSAAGWRGRPRRTQR